MLHRRYFPLLTRGKVKNKEAKMTDKKSPYNGIVPPRVWPPQHIEPDESLLPVPYLNNPPSVIPIDTGRQLFVDDF